MNWIQETLSEFGRQIGLASLELGRHGAAQLTFPDGALLMVEPVDSAEDTLALVVLGRPAGHEVAALLRTALRQASVLNAGPFAVQVALRGEGADTLLLALVRIESRAFTAQALAQAVDFLSRWLDDVQSRAR